MNGTCGGFNDRSAVGSTVGELKRTVTKAMWDQFIKKIKDQIHDGNSSQGQGGGNNPPMPPEPD